MRSVLKQTYFSYNPFLDNKLLPNCIEIRASSNLFFYFTAYITRPAVKIVNRTESSLLFEYQPPEIHGAHTGYLVWLNGISSLRLANSSYTKNFTLHDGLVFNISSLLPYFTYLIAITPLELQTIRSATYLVGSTLESGE